MHAMCYTPWEMVQIFEKFGRNLNRKWAGVLLDGLFVKEGPRLRGKCIEGGVAGGNAGERGLWNGGVGRTETAFQGMSSREFADSRICSTCDCSESS